MSDERKIFAGQLGTDQLGKRVRVKVLSGAVIEDMLMMVRHEAKVTIVGLASLVPSREFGDGFATDPAEVVTVLS